MTRFWYTGSALLLGNLVVIFLAITVGQQMTSPQMAYDARTGDDHDIFILDVTHRLIHNLTHRDGVDSSPAWSPDGQHIAFESWRDGVRSVYVMEADGSNPRRLTNHDDASEYAPRWIDNGTAILFRYYKRPEAAIFQVRPDGSDLRRVESTGTYQPTITSIDIVSIPFGGPEPEPAQDEEFQLPVSFRLAGNSTMQWSQDRQLGAFLSVGTRVAPEVFILDSTDNSLTQITTDGLVKHNLSWRP